MLKNNLQNTALCDNHIHIAWINENDQNQQIVTKISFTMYSKFGKVQKKNYTSSVRAEQVKPELQMEDHS